MIDCRIVEYYSFARVLNFIAISSVIIYHTVGDFWNDNLNSVFLRWCYITSIDFDKNLWDKTNRFRLQIHTHSTDTHIVFLLLARSLRDQQDERRCLNVWTPLFDLRIETKPKAINRTQICIFVRNSRQRLTVFMFSTLQFYVKRMEIVRNK